MLRLAGETVEEPPPNCLTLTRYFYPVSERSEEALQAQLVQADRVLVATIVRPLLPHQREALLCLVSDLVSGLAAAASQPFERSLLVKALNKGMYQVAAAEFHSFCFIDGKVQTRAWEKRKAEAYLFSLGKLLFE